MANVESGFSRIAAISDQAVHITRDIESQVRSQFVVPFRKQTNARFDDRLPPRRFVDVRERIDDDRHVAVDLRPCRKGNKKNQNRSRDRLT